MNPFANLEKSSPSWSRFSTDDEYLYESYFRKVNTEGGYEHNFAYYMQECRHAAVKLERDGYLATLYTRSDTSDYAIFLPPVGNVESYYENIEAVCREVAHHLPKRLLLRKLDRAAYDTVCATSGFTPMDVKAYKNPRELPEDIYPQVIIDTNASSRLSGGRYVKIRNHIASLAREHSVYFADLAIDALVDAREAVLDWTTSKSSRLRTLRDGDVQVVDNAGVDPDSFTVFLDRFAEVGPRADHVMRVMRVDDDIVGFTYAAKTSSTSYALYASLCKSSYRGASDSLMHDVIKTLAEAQVPLLNLGGSETESLFAYKSKWSSVEKRPSFECRYDGAEGGA